MSCDVLKDRILEMQDEILEAIQKNVRIESVRGEAQPDAPYGKGPKAALDDLLALGKSLGFQTGQADNRVGWIEYGEGEEMVGVLGHVDVVPAGEGWKYPAYGAEIHDGVLYGRGVLDDKGPTIGALFAMKAIRDLKLPIDRRIRILFGSDEECGSSCVKYYVENGYELPAIGFTPDAEFPAIFFEKGMANFTIGSSVEENGTIEVESFNGGIASNSVPADCRLVVKGDLNVCPAEGITFKKEDGKTIVEAVGKSSHGSRPEMGENAVIKLLSAVRENTFGGDFQKLMEFLLDKIGTETNGESLGIHYSDAETGDTTLNLGMVRYDGKEFSFTLDIRYPKNADGKSIEDSIQKQVDDSGFVVSSHSDMSPLYVPKDSELVSKLMRVYAKETGDESDALAIGGGTYAKEFPNMVAFGPQFPGDPDVIHQVNECVEIDKLMKMIQIVALAIYELAQK